MKLTGTACTEALSEAEEAGGRERAGDNAGGVRVERMVRQNAWFVSQTFAQVRLNDGLGLGNSRQGWKIYL
jgi:hypothetical protein